MLLKILVPPCDLECFRFLFGLVEVYWNVRRKLQTNGSTRLHIQFLSRVWGCSFCLAARLIRTTGGTDFIFAQLIPSFLPAIPGRRSLVALWLYVLWLLTNVSYSFTSLGSFVPRNGLAREEWHSRKQ